MLSRLAHRRPEEGGFATPRVAPMVAVPTRGFRSGESRERRERCARQVRPGSVRKCARGCVFGAGVVGSVAMRMRDRRASCGAVLWNDLLRGSLQAGPRRRTWPGGKIRSEAPCAWELTARISSGFGKETDCGAPEPFRLGSSEVSSLHEPGPTSRFLAHHPSLNAACLVDLRTTPGMQAVSG